MKTYIEILIPHLRKSLIRSITRILVMVTVITVVAISSLYWMPLLNDHLSAGKNDDPYVDAKLAAEEIIQVLYKIDYRDQAGWLQQVEEISSETGYEIVTMLVAPKIWSLIIENHIVSEVVEIQVGDPIASGEGQGDSWLILPVSFRMDPPWNDNLPTVSTYLLLNKIEGEWKFEMLLNEDQLRGFEEPEYTSGGDS